jgi:hypothetical protein
MVAGSQNPPTNLIFKNPARKPRIFTSKTE